MRPRDFFGVGVRLIGVWAWTQAAYQGYWSALKSAGTGFGSPYTTLLSDLSWAIINALVGTALIAGARFLFGLRMVTRLGRPTLALPTAFRVMRDRMVSSRNSKREILSAVAHAAWPSRHASSLE